MEKYGYIPQIEEGVVFSDPWYDADVWCQYRKDFSESNWLMRMETKRNEEYSCLDFDLFIGRPTVMSSVEVNHHGAESFSLSHLGHHEITEAEIGMDTARIFCGSGKNWRLFGESAALHTGTDGFFGALFIFTCKGEDTPAGFVLMGNIDENFANEESLFRHMLSGFDGKEISREEYLQKTSLDTLANKILLSNELRIAENNNELHQAPSRDEPER